MEILNNTAKNIAHEYAMRYVLDDVDGEYNFMLDECFMFNQALTENNIRSLIEDIVYSLRAYYNIKVNIKGVYLKSNILRLNFITKDNGYLDLTNIFVQQKVEI